MLDRAPQITTAPDAAPLPAGDGRLRLRDVAPEAQPALRDVSRRRGR